MATQTFQHSSFSDGLVTVELDVNDATWNLSRVRCYNNSNYPAKAFIYENGGLRFTATAPANDTTTWNVSGVKLGWDTIDGGIMMGAYVMQVQWPAV